MATGSAGGLPHSVVMMTAGAVHVTVREFFLGRGTHFGDLHVEVERLTGERMIAVHGHHVAGDAGDDDLPRTILSLLEVTGVDPERFTIELTESGPIADLGRAARNIWRLRRHRVRVALDDFGSHFSTQTRLDSLDVDEVKIDKSLVFGLECMDEQRRIVEHVIELARQRGMTVVAEGVETHASLDLLGSLGVDRAQGYLLGKPQFEAQLPPVLRRWGRTSEVDVFCSHSQLSLPGFQEGRAD